MTDIVTHRCSKHYKYHDPLPLTELKEYFTKNKFLKIRGKNLKGRHEDIKHGLEILDENVDEKFLGRITYKEKKMEPISKKYYWKKHIVDFMILKKPSVLILSGSRSIMSKIIEGFDNALQTGIKRENYFGSYEYTSKNKQPIGKYVVKKIASLIEAQEDNNLFDPHFKGFANNTYNRGGECFYRIDGNSACTINTFYATTVANVKFWFPKSTQFQQMIELFI